MSNKAVRNWYQKQVKKIKTNLAPTRKNAQSVCDQRAQLKQKARNKMADQDARRKLDQDYPIRDFDYYMKKYQQQGYTGMDLWKRIMQGGGTTNRNVDRLFDL